MIAGETFLFKARIRRSDSKEIEAEFNSRLVVSTGEPHVHVVIRDITSRNQKEREFTVFDYAMRSISEAITITDEHNTIIFVNESFLRMYGYEREELIGSSINILRAEETLPPVNEILSATLESGWQGELINRRKDGTTFPIWLSTSIVRDENGMPLALIGITTDITERKNAEKARKEAEEALRASEEYFREVIENVSDIIFVVDRNGTIKYTSPSIERVLGYPVKEVVGKNAFQFIHPSDARRSLVVFWKAVRLKESSIHETFCIVHKDGSERFLEGLGRNLLDHPSIAGFIMIVHDVTENRKAEVALRESRDQLRILESPSRDGPRERTKIYCPRNA